MVEDRDRDSERTQPFEEALDALRTTLADEQTPNSWRRDITLIGLLAAIFGVVAWYALLVERDQPIMVEIQVAGPDDARLAWVQAGFEQALVAYAHAGNRVRLQKAPDAEGAQPNNPLLDLGFGAQAPQAVLQVVLDSNSTPGILKADLELVREEHTQRAVLTGYPSGLADLASRTSMQVFTWLEVDPYTRSERVTAQGEYPSDPEAGRHYALGLQALRRGEGGLATTELARAQRIVPDHPMVNAALAEAYAFLGYRSQALQYVRVAYDQGGSLSREKQLAIEARLRLLEHDWLEAETLYLALTAFYPEEISYGLALAEAQYLGSRAQDSLETLRELRANPLFGDDPRIDLLEARVWWRTGDWRKGVVAAERAVETAQRLGHSGILARALVTRADMDGDPSGSGLDLANELFLEMSDLFGQSQVLREHGDRLVAAGRLDEGIAAYDQSIDISNRLGNDAERDAALQAQAIAYDLKGALEAGYETKLSLLDSSRRRGQNIRAAIGMENIGISTMKLGRMEESLQWFDDAYIEFVEHTDLIGIAWHPYQKGRVLARMGALEQARSLFEQALVNAQKHPEGYLELHTLYELGRLDVFERKSEASGRLERLAQSYDEAGLHLDTADTLLVLARHEALEGNTDQAMAHVFKAKQVFLEADARYYLARAETLRLRLGDTDACESLGKLADTLEQRNVALIAIASLQVCAGRSDDLYKLVEEARQLKLFEPELALTALLDKQAAQELAFTRGWVADDYWMEH